MDTRTDLQDLIRDNVTLPTLPSIVLRIGELIEDPDSGTAEIGALVAQDAPLAAKVLRVVNSAFYGLRARCVSTEQASTVLGVRVLRNIVTQASIISRFDHLDSTPRFDVQDLWVHSIRTAQACSALAEAARRTTSLRPDEFYVCGLLHDLGKVVMLDALGDAYIDAVCASEDNGASLPLLERERFGFDHTEVGALIAERWGLPDDISEAIRYHHGPEERLAQDPVVALVAGADRMVELVGGGNDEEAPACFGERLLGQLELTDDDVRRIFRQLVEADAPEL